jgi:hypothetical protein
MYLATQWWHRLATVVFWAWFVFVLLHAWKLLIGDPFISCVDTQILYETTLGKPSTLDCGGNAFAYLLLNLKTSSALEVGGGSILVAAVLYVVVVLPSVLYRLVLYVAKGGAWRDAKAVRP